MNNKETAMNSKEIAENWKEHSNVMVTREQMTTLVKAHLDLVEKLENPTDEMKAVGLRAIDSHYVATARVILIFKAMVKVARAE